MYDFKKLGIITFSDLAISLNEKLTYTTASVSAMLSNPVGNLFTERITATLAAANGLEGGLNTELVKLGLQKMRTSAKRAFRQALPAEIAQIYAAIVAKYGLKSAALLLIFPQGRSIFSRASDEALNNPLAQLVTSITPYVTDLTQAVLDHAIALKTTWEGLYQDASLAKKAKKGVAGTKHTLSAALDIELHKNLMWVCYNFPGDAAKIALYCPQEGLLNRVTHKLTTAEITAAEFDLATMTVQLTFKGKNAETFRLQRRLFGQADYVDVASDIEASDEETTTYSDILPALGHYEYTVIAGRGAYETQPSAPFAVNAA